MELDQPDQMRAFLEETRGDIIDLLGERSATIKELSEALGKPKGTIGHHVSVLAEQGLIRVVRTKKVRAIEAKYYGRTARTFLLGGVMNQDTSVAPEFFLTAAASEYANAASSIGEKGDDTPLSTLRYARIPESRAREWSKRLIELTEEFAGEERGGDTTYALVVGFYPTAKPRLPDPDGPAQEVKSAT
ncbi:MAG: winged helix-turn-helix domain-containing protein [Acidimicrobiia bacterium]